MYLVLLVTWFDVWEYVLQGNQEYGHVVALQTYVLHTLGVRMVLQSLVVDLSMSRNEKEMVASERPFGVPSVCARFILARLKIRFRIVRFSWRLRLLDPFITQSNKSNYMMSNADGSYKELYLA
jgi:hypothetical protein